MGLNVAVIGAGFAGLSAAEALKRSGHAVKVFEARDRTGGRVHSAMSENGVVVELGAEFIAAGNTHVAGYARALGLSLVNRDARFGDRRLAGHEEIPEDELRSALLGADALLPVSAGEGLTVAEALSRVPAPSEVLDAIGARIQVTAATEIETLPVASLDSFSHAFDGEPGSSVAGGNALIADSLAARLGEAVHLNDSVSAIEWNDDGATLTTTSGATSVDRVVIAVAAPAVSMIKFSPPLPDQKVKAIGKVVMGHAAKLFVPLKETTGNDGVLSIGRSYWSWTGNGADGQPAPMAHCFAGSARALEGLSVAGGHDEWVADLLHTLRPELVRDAQLSPMLVNWDKDPWTCGAYSAGGWVTSSEGQSALCEPVGPIFFAGEHTAGRNHALMDGALQSGVAAARAIDPGASALID